MQGYSAKNKNQKLCHWTMDEIHNIVTPYHTTIDEYMILFQKGRERGDNE